MRLLERQSLTTICEILNTIYLKKIKQNKSTDLIKKWYKINKLDKITKMKEYLSTKDFIINFKLLFLPIEKSILNFFLKNKHLGARYPISPNMHLPLAYTYMQY